MREKDLANSDRTPQVNEHVSITFDGTLFEVGPNYRLIWIRRRQIARLYSIDVLHEGIILKECWSKLPSHGKTPHTRVGHVQHQWSLFFKHECDSIIIRDFRLDRDWDHISLGDFEAPIEKTETFIML